MGLVIQVVEEAFAAHGRGQAIMPPKIYISLQAHKGDFRAMPAYLAGAAGLKWVNSHAENPSLHNMPSVMAVLIYSDPETGFPLAIMDATDITNFRTGAGSAVASKYLARKDSKSMGLVGCGAQGVTQLMAISRLFQLEHVYVYDISRQRLQEFKDQNQTYPIEETSLEGVFQADIVCTTTPSRQPIIKREWVRPGTHINAIGADAPGKQELDPQILKDAKVVVDDAAQAFHSGEVNVPLAQKQLTKQDIYGTLGEVVAGIKKGREAEEITVFDSTGLAIQDIAVARVIYETATKRGLGHWIDMIGLVPAQQA
jgi:alanine dehydrogenase